MPHATIASGWVSKTLNSKRVRPRALCLVAQAYRRDIRKAKVILYNAGHFALETHTKEIATEITTFLKDVSNNNNP